MTAIAGTMRLKTAPRNAASENENSVHAANATPSSAKDSGSIELTWPSSRNGR